MAEGDARVRATIEKYFGIGPEEVDSVLASVATLQLDGGDWLFRQGDAGDSLYFLVRGRLQVSVRGDAAAPDAAGTVLGEIAPGESVGELGLLTGASRSASVRALRSSELVRIDRATFERLAQQHPTLVLRLAGSIAATLQKRTARAPSSARGLRTITLLALDQSERAREFRTELVSGLGRTGPTVTVTRADLERYGGAPDGVVPAEFRGWLHETEDQNRFVIFECAAQDSVWVRFALQQSDVVLSYADASGNPLPDTGERELLERNDKLQARRVLVLLQPARSDAIRGTARWLAPRRVDFHLHVRADSLGDTERVVRVLSGNAVGLVLAAGAARGLSHYGVYRALAEAGVPIDWIGGTSVGAMIGATMATGWPYEEMLEKARAAFVHAKPFSEWTLPLISLIRGKRIWRQLKRFLDLDIEDLPTPFFCVSCNFNSGALNLHESGPLPLALRASAALPGVLPPAVYQRQLAIDGMVLNNLPVDLMQHKPVGRIVAVDLSSTKEYQVEYNYLPSPWLVLRQRLLPFGRKVRAPSLMTVMLKATELGTLAHVRELGQRADLLLTPPVRQFGMMDLGAMDKIVAAGYAYAKPEVAAWAERTAKG